MTFQIGERVVYPNHGVAVIENISARSFGAQFERFYLLRINSSRMTVMVPFSHADDVGLRKVTKAAEIAKVLEFLAKGRTKSCQDWKDRFRENSDKMRFGCLLETAEVLKCLLILQKDKPLSFREKKMLDRARHMLLTEVATSRSLPEPAAEDVLNEALGKSHLRFPEPL
ncbi:MAG TPA: CarD family transcriptional regulator [Bryobacteraceae bacterium]|nr:CarD family transcriptional regulator [Bryobacteraceae bacterium]